MAVLAYTIGFNALVWMNTGTFRLITIYFEIPDDSAFISMPLNETDAYYWKKHVLFIICDASDEF